MPRPKGYPATKKDSAHRDGKRYAICAELNPVIEAEAEKAGMSLGDWLASAVKLLAGMGTKEAATEDIELAETVAPTVEPKPEKERVEGVPEKAYEITSDEEIAATLFEAYADEKGLPQTGVEGEDWDDVTQNLMLGDDIAKRLWALAKEKHGKFWDARREEAAKTIQSKWLTKEQKYKIADWMAQAHSTEQEALDWLGYECPDGKYSSMSAKQITQELGDYFDASHLMIRQEFTILRKRVTQKLRESGSDMSIGFTTVARAVAELWDQTYVGMMEFGLGEASVFENRWLGFGEIPDDLTQIQQFVLASIQDRHLAVLARLEA